MFNEQRVAFDEAMGLMRLPTSALKKTEVVHAPASYYYYYYYYYVLL